MQMAYCCLVLSKLYYHYALLVSIVLLLKLSNYFSAILLALLLIFAIYNFIKLNH